MAVFHLFFELCRFINDKSETRTCVNANVKENLTNKFNDSSILILEKHNLKVYNTSSMGNSFHRAINFLVMVDDDHE